MRIAEINDVASVASEITRGLRERGHDVTLLQPRLVGAKLHPLVKPVVGPARAADWIDLIHTMRSGAYDLAHIHYAYLGNVGVLGGFPYILHCHGTDLRGSTVFTRPLIRNALTHARHVFYSTPDLSAYVDPIRPDAEFLPNPIDTEFFAPTVPASERTGVFICCALTEIKGVARLYDACRRLSTQRPDIRVTAIAGGPYTAMFNELPNVTLLPHQQRWKFPGIINQHGVVLGWVRLGIAGMAELEAMACGRPVVTWFNQAHIYPQEPPFVRAVDGFDIANAIIQLVDDPERRDRLGAEGRAWVQKYHRLDQAVARVEEVAEAIIANKPVPATSWPPAA
jgi:glycosyltransferase involved in cell wall biosynthesis